MNKKVFLILSLLIGFAIVYLNLRNTKNTNRYSNDHGNYFIDKGNRLFIVPSTYVIIGNRHDIFLYNETANDVELAKDLKIKPNHFRILNMRESDSLILNNGIKFTFSNDNELEVEDNNSQISGLGGEFLNDYKVPNGVEWAFVIVEPGEGD
ncbi:hypothetical protein [Winogradskyella aquimaris]|uniref:FHA domain-containing protein n=1 Tax=Winogradskyella aquimaris TaxID=864074 RepID=A0ABU5EJY2_9FLAO|nr:hypothetical protein [Winogradskyella aquimaris]MDY2586369.1 hypothetical protein [Winogradskyella aquimaris]